MAGGVLIAGARGGGGGQVLRAALSLSVVTGRPVRVVGIRLRRTPPGLTAAHMAAIRAAVRVCDGRVGGAEIGSTDVYFVPGKLHAAEFTESAGPAGDAGEVLQMVALPLSLAEGASRVTVRGATHLPGGPTFDFLESDWAPAMREIGLPLSVKLVQSGYRPQGGGEILALVPGNARPKPFEKRMRGNLRMIRGSVFVSRLPEAMATRIAREARRQLRRSGVAVKVDVVPRPAGGPGLGIHLVAVTHDDGQYGFSFLAEKGRAAERIARRAVNVLFSWLDTGAALPQFLAEQILLPLCLANGPSTYTTSKVTGHLVDVAEVARRFLPVEIEIDRQEGEPSAIRVVPT